VSLGEGRLEPTGVVLVLVVGVAVANVVPKTLSNWSMAMW
jgi:hypothetical protein